MKKRETPGDRFYRVCKERGIEMTTYGIACPAHGQMPAVQLKSGNFDCRLCTYHAITSRTGKYHN